MNAKPVAWIDPKELDMDVSTTVTKNKQFDTDIPLYTAPQTYCPSENNEAYEKGFIDGMQKQTKSSVDRWVNANIQKPLKKEDIDLIASNCWYEDEDLQFFNYKKFARIIEERHGIK